MRSPACVGTYQEDQRNQIPGLDPQNNTFYLVGEEAYSNSTTRQLTFANDAEAIGTGASAEETLVVADGVANGDGWWYFPAVSMSVGETIGSKTYFKVIASIPTGASAPYKNGFQFDVFDAAGGNGEATPSGNSISGATSFAYSINYDMENDLKNGNEIYFYPFVPNSVTTGNYIVFSNHDGDNGGTSYTSWFGGPDSAGVPLSTPSNTFRNDSYQVDMDSKKNQTWTDRIVSTLGANNTTEFYYWYGYGNNYSNDTVAMPASTNDMLKIYSVDFSNYGNTPNAVIVDVGDGSAPIGGTQRVYFQIKDNLGNDHLESMTLTLGLTGGSTVSDSSDGVADLSLTTNNDGFGWIDITNGAQVLETVSVNWTIGGGFDNNGSASGDVQFSNFIWDGSTDNDWFDGTNWAGGTVPGPTDNPTIPVVGTVYPILTRAVSGGVDGINNLTIQAGASLDLGGFLLEVGGDLGHSGSITNSGAGANITVAGTADLGGSINTSGGDISFGDAVSLTGHSSLVSGGGFISFASTINDDGFGPWDLTLSSGTGNITVTGAIGTANPIDDLSISSAADVTFSGNVSAGTVSQTAGSGTTQFVSSLSTSGSGGIDLNGTAFTFGTGITTTGAGSVNITNSGVLTIPPTSTVSSDAGFNVDGNGAISLAADITTNAADLLFSGTGTLTIADNGAGSDVVLNSGGGVISFAGDVTGNGLLELAAGAGNVNFTSTVGSGGALSGLLVNTSGALSFSSTIAFDDEGLDLNMATGSFSGTVTGTTNGNVTLTNTGLLTLGGSADFNIDGVFSQDGSGDVQSAADIATTGNNISFTSALTLTGNSAYSTGAGAGNIAFGNTVNTDNNPWTLDLTAGTGDVTFTGVVGTADGSTTRPSTLTIVSAGTVNQNNHVFLSGDLVLTAGTWSVGAFTLDFDGSLSGAGNLTSTDVTVINVGTNFGLSGTFIPGSSVVTFDEAAASSAGAYTFYDLSINKAGAANTVDSTGIWIVTNSFTMTQGDWTAGAFTHQIAGNWNSSSANFTWDETGNTINLTSTNPGIITGGGAADPFNNLSLDDGGVLSASDVNVTGTLLITAGTVNPAARILTVGDLDHQNALASITGTTGSVLVTDGTLGSGISMDGGVISFSGGAVSLTGTTSLTTTPTGGAITLDSTFSGGFDLVVDAGGAAVNITAGLGDSGAALTPLTVVSLTGSVINLGANIETADSNLSFNSPVVLTANSGLNSGGGVGNIVFSDTLNTDNNPWTLDLTAGTGSLTFSGIVGTSAVSTARPSDLTVSAGGGTGQNNSIFISGDLTNSTGNWITNGNVLNLSGTYTNTGTVTAGASSITVGDNWNNTGGTFTAGTSSVTLGGDAAGGHTITNAGGANGFYDLTIIADTYSSAAAMDVGRNLVVSGGSLTHTAGVLNVTGTADLTGGSLTVNTTGSLSVGGIMTISNAASTYDGTGAGTLGSDFNLTAGTADGSGDLGIAGDVNLSGTATLQGTGRTLTVSGNWNQSAATSTFTATSGTVSLTAANPSITAVDSFYDLTIAAAASQSSNVTVSNILTTGTGNFATGTNDLTVSDLIHQNGGTISGTTGNVALNDGTLANNITKTGGAIDISGGTLIDLTGPVQLDAGGGTINIATDFSGAQTLTISAGTSTISSNLGTTVDLASLTATGTVLMTSLVDTSGNILFNNNVVLNGGNSTLTSSAGNITFSGTIEDDVAAAVRNLTLNSGGLITMTGTVGNTRPIGTLSVTAAATGVTAGSSIDADSMTITNGSAVDLNGTVTVPNGFSSTGSTFDNTGASITTTDSLITINHTGLVTLGSSLSSGNGNTAISSGVSISLDADISTVDGTININDPLNLTDTLGLAPNLISIASSGDGSITFNSDITGINDTDLTVSSAGAGNITFNADVNGLTGMDLSVSSATGDIQFINAAIGSGVGETIGDITISGNNVALYSVGTTAQAGSDNTLTVNAAGLIELTGADYNTGNNQRFNTTAGEILFSLNGGAPGAGEMNAGAGDIQFGDISLGDVYLDYDSAFTLTLQSNVTVSKFVFYSGTLDLNGNRLYTTNNGGGDFVVFGSGFDPNDPDWPVADNRFDYDDRFNGLLPHDPLLGNYDAVFSPLDASQIESGANFYVNGTDLTGTANWYLNVQDNNAAIPTFNLGTDSTNWGSPYNVYFNGTVSYSLLNDAAAPDPIVTNGTVAAPVFVAANNSGHGVTDGTNNTPYFSGTNATSNDAKGWVLNSTGPERLEIASIETVWDNYLRLTFTQMVENTNNQIQAAISATSGRLDDLKMNIDGGGAGAPSITDAYVSIDLDDPVGGMAPVSTTGAGDLLSFYVLVDDTWNTDATGLSAGAVAQSTDSAGSDKAIIPDFGLFKSMLYNAGSQAPVRDYQAGIGGHFTATTDECPPLVVAVKTDNHGATADGYDYHNYMHIRFSEAVEFTEDGGATLVGFGATPTTVRSNAYDLDGGSTKYLGHIPNITSSAVTIPGILDYDGSVETGSTESRGYFTGSNDGTDQVNVLDRSNDYELQISIASFHNGTTWPGYIGESGMDMTQPNTFTGLVTPNVRDASGNTGAVNTGFVNTDLPDVGWVGGTGWDVDPPRVAPYKIAGITEVIPLANASNKLYRFEYHILDDYYQNSGSWDSDISHPDSSKGIRDSVFTTYGDPDAFVFEASGITPLVPHSNSFSTNVNNDVFGNVDILPPDDPYFSIDVNPAAHSWDILTKIWTGYNETTGLMTDLAGNRLRSFTQIRAVESIPPEIDLTLTAPGYDWIYVQFSEKVYGDAGAATSIDENDFYYSGGSMSIVSVEAYPGGEANRDFIFRLSDSLVRNDIFTGRIVVKPLSVFDEEGNPYRDKFIRRISDLGIDIVEPVWASDGIHDEDIQSGTSMRVFDGTGRLMDRDILMQVRINASAVQNLSMRMYFDANVSDSRVYGSGNLWLPQYHPILSPVGNFAARYVNTANSPGNGLHDFVIPSTDRDMEVGNTMEFIFMIDDLPCVRLQNSSDLFSFEPWKFSISDIRKQRGGVTILNNVVNPNNGDKAVLMYEVENPGVVTAQIFTLNGNLVKILHRGRQAAGSYQYVWDGRNNAGNVVARGIYFVRVVGPDMDEIRKIMIVK
ncbi:MAG: FlgD immunoglobulin-like domain containing protein [Spirochaetales bacterium]|nr:FlgD immunoglobulin-like domain containing protein [Spirochaetales bacterium]